ncbi:MAG TPA: hypothetical protein ENK60_08320, partial [Anaerolineae bacterium]|nr:hypothetical protein [Anaerolineae bacterium]
MYKKFLSISFTLLLTATLFAACQTPSQPAAQSAPTNTAAPAPTQAPAITPSVTVEDQEVQDGKVVVAKVVSPGSGWIVIHAQKDGKPGPILGFAAVKEGENENVAVEIDASKATDILYAMLHTDA